MYDKPCYWLNDLGRDANDYVGKKCANLGEMQSLGIPVPEGFVLSIKANQIFLESTGAKQEVLNFLEPLRGVNQPEMTQVEELSRKIHDTIVSRTMPAVLRTPIVKLYTQLCQKLDMPEVPVAVRSSGAVSMPGQMETYLNVSGQKAVIDHIKKVWASAYTPRAIFWRLRHDELNLTDVGIGIAILHMITPRAAGVGFTVHPASGDRKKVMIEGNWGVGESIVQGLVMPDTFLVNKKDLTLNSASIGTKRKYYEVMDSGIELKKVPLERRSIPCLSDEEIIAITEQALRLEAHFKTPQDFEWVIDEQTRALFIVQSRPVKNIQTEKSATDKILDLMLARMK